MEPPAFDMSDAPILQRSLPEKVLNDLELFLNDIKLDIDTAKKNKRGYLVRFEFFLATELGKTLQELRENITEAELIYWAGYYEIKHEEEKRALQRQKRKSM